MARILTVDDDPVTLFVMGKILGQAGHEPVKASEAIEAIEVATHQRFDVALVDYQLPGCSGLWIMQQLRELQPDCPRVLVSGELELPVIIDAVNRGEITRVLQKPIDAEKVIGAVDDALASRERIEVVLEARREASRQEAIARLVEYLDGDTLRLALQPIVTATEARPMGYEALLRSTHPGFQGPPTLLALAESVDMLGDLSAEVMRIAGRWMQRLPAGRHLFVNLHPRELSEPEAMCERLAPLAPWADRVVLEITERSRLVGSDWRRAVQMARAQGFRVAVDDLGAGYSSLSVLAELEPRYIKIDMSIIRDVDTTPRKQRLVELLCRFAEASDAEVIAEGIETASEAAALRDVGVHLMQGYFFARPSLEPDLS